MSTINQSGEALERSVIRFILRYSVRQQLVIVFLTVVALPVYYVSLELPKQIINRAIGGSAEQFPQPITIFGYQIANLTQLELLIGLCVLFLLFVLANLALKFVLNVYKGLLGERMLRRLRYQLFDRVIRFPLPQFRRTPKGDLVSMITTEVESIGGFVGEALATPLYQGGLLITALIFIFVQDWVMGLLAVAFYPIQVIVIPYLQTQVNELGRRRVQEVRNLSNKLNETVELASEIHANRTERYELAEFSARLSRIFRIRYQIYHKKFLIKFLNNFFGQLTPFLFFAVGGYLVISGGMTLGELVAILAAYKDLAPPWRELLDFYQDQQNARIRYDQIVSTFTVAPSNMPETAAIDGARDTAPKGDLKGVDISIEYDGNSFLRDVSFDMRLDEHVAIIGPSESENRHLAWLIAGLIEPTTGSLQIGKTPYSGISSSWFDRRVAYLDNDPGFMAGTVFDNIIYPLKRSPQAEESADPVIPANVPGGSSEELLTGNSIDDVAENWIDYQSLGLSGPDDLKQAVLHVLEITEFTQDVFDLGLSAFVDPAAHPEIAAGIVSARRSLRTALTANEFRGTVALLDPLIYNPHATVLENILFGDPIGPRYEPAQIMDRAHFRRIIKKSRLDRLLLALGLEIAQSLPSSAASSLNAINLAGEDAQQLQKTSIRVVLARAALRGLNKITGKEKRRLQFLALQYVPSSDQVSRLDEEFMDRVLAARKLFTNQLTPRRQAWISAYDPDAYCPGLNVSENILFAKIAPGHQDLPLRLRNAMLQVLGDEKLRDSIIESGLLYEIGPEGSTFSSSQKQQLAIARAVLKQPDLLVACQGTAGLGDQVEQRVIKNVRNELRGRGVCWIMSDESLANQFDRSLRI